MHKLSILIHIILILQLPPLLAYSTGQGVDGWPGGQALSNAPMSSFHC